MSIFKRKSKQVVGVDISSTSVKLVELSKKGNGYQVESFAVAPLPDGAVVEKNISDVNAVAGVVRQVVKQARCQSRHVAVAVAGSAVITKNINMPAGLSGDDLEYQVNLEADQHIPFPLEDVAIDFEEQGIDESSGQKKVLLVACRKDNVDSRTTVLEQAGLKPKIVDIEAFAIERVAPLLADDWDTQGQLVAVVDIGATVTTLSVLLDNNTIYSREQLFGGFHLTEEIQRRYGLSLSEAEQAKLSGGLPDDYLGEVLEPFKEKILQQVLRSLQFFYSSGSYHQVDHIILAGGGSHIPGLVPLLQQHLDTLVSIANPFRQMSVPGKVNRDELFDKSSCLMVATGLAMRSFT